MSLPDAPHCSGARHVIKMAGMLLVAEMEEWLMVGQHCRLSIWLREGIQITNSAVSDGKIQITNYSVAEKRALVY